jgi:hypothetical protein
MRKEKDPNLILYFWQMDPDPGGPKTCKSCGSGSSTLISIIIFQRFWVDSPGKWVSSRTCISSSLSSIRVGLRRIIFLSIFLNNSWQDVPGICCLECPLLGSLFALHDWDGDLIHEIVNLGLQGFYERRGLWTSIITRCFLTYGIKSNSIVDVKRRIG